MELEFLDANLAAFSRRYPKQPLELTAHEAPKRRFVVNSSLSGQRVISLEESANKPLFLNSRVDPRREAERVVLEQKLSEKDTSVVCIIGLGLGELPNEALKVVNSKTTILIWEPLREALLAAFESTDLRDLINNPRVLIYTEPLAAEAAKGFASLLDPTIVKDWTIAITLGRFEVDPESVKAFYAELYSQTNAKRLLLQTGLQHSKTFLKNAFQNLTVAPAATPMQSLIGSALGKSVVVVSAGPSLSKAIPFLKEVQSEVLIVAVGAAWKTLRKSEIVPHYVVLLDPFERTASEFEGQEVATETLVADFSGFPSVVTSFSGARVMYCSNSDLEEIVKAITGQSWGCLEQGGSVAHVALSFAKRLAPTAIYLVGQDLAFTGGITHVATHVDSQRVDGKFSPKHGPLHEVEAFGGEGSVLTSRSLDTFRVWFEAYPHKENIFNATEGGARIRGIEELSLREMRDRIMSNTTISTAASNPRSLLKVSGSRSEMRDRLRRLAVQFLELEGYATECKRLLREIESTNDESATSALKLKFNQKARVFADSQPSVAAVIDYIAKAEMFETQRRMNTHDNSELDKVATNLTFYSQLEASLKLARELIMDTRSRQKKAGPRPGSK